MYFITGTDANGNLLSGVKNPLVVNQACFFIRNTNINERVNNSNALLVDSMLMGIEIFDKEL